MLLYPIAKFFIKHIMFYNEINIKKYNFTSVKLSLKTILIVDNTRKTKHE